MNNRDELLDNLESLYRFIFTLLDVSLVFNSPTHYTTKFQNISKFLTHQITFLTSYIIFFSSLLLSFDATSLFPTKAIFSL